MYSTYALHVTGKVLITDLTNISPYTYISTTRYVSMHVRNYDDYGMIGSFHKCGITIPS
jgi:hypothetical protein